MNTLSSFSTVIAAIMAIMTTVVSWRALRDHSTLNNPVIAACDGLLSFLGLRYLPEGLAHTVLFGYVALTIAILFMLLFMAFQKARRAWFLNNPSKTNEKQAPRWPTQRDDGTLARTRRWIRHRRQIDDGHSSIP
jgi:ABC-type Co2+ transport system permease subunit